MSDKNTVTRLSVRQAWLRSLYVAYTKLDSWTTSGVPEVDQELVATWGPVSKGSKPYEIPYNGDAATAAIYANPTAAITPLGQALSRNGTGAKVPKGMAKMAASQDDRGMSPWALKAVADARSVPKFDQCSKSNLDDKTLSQAIWAVWQTMAGKDRAKRIAKAWMLEEGIEPDLIPWSQVRYDAMRAMPGWRNCKASLLTPYAWAVLYWATYQQLPDGIPDGKDAATAAILLADEIPADPTTDVHVHTEGGVKTRRGRKTASETI